jgi:chromosome partitioning protein
VGKTTLALNLAYALATRGWRTALLDVDPQGGVGLSLVGRAREAPGFAGWRAGIPLESCLVPTRNTRLTLLPVGTIPWGNVVPWSSSLADGVELWRLIEALQGRQDVLLIDTPSGLLGPTLGVIRSATDLLLPVQAEPLSLRAIPQLLEVLAAQQDSRPSARLIGVVLTMLRFREETPLSVAQEAWELLPERLLLEAFVPRDPSLVVASAKGVPVGLLGRRPPPVTTVFDRIAQELEPRLGLAEESDDEAIPLVD